MRVREDLLDPATPSGVEVIQLTEGELPSCHIYMEAQIFTPDSKRFLLHESAHPHGSDRHDPRHRYLVCDVEDGFSLRPITEEVGATAPSLSPDGQFVYYFVDETEPGGGRLTLKRVRLDGRERETLFVLDSPIPGTAYRPSRIYPLSTIRADGGCLALSCYLGDGQMESQPWGLMVFDLEGPTVRLILQGPSWCNIHPQFCRAREGTAMHDILVQENHGCRYAPDGRLVQLTGGTGADIHVIRDDGSNLRNLPWGRDGNEFCQGHQCWRGRTTWAITSTETRDVDEEQLIESQPVPPKDHLGLRSPGGVRNHLSRSFPKPSFCHFATDIAGRRLVSDTRKRDQGGRVWLAKLGEPGKEPLSHWVPLARPHSSWKKEAHIHPFLSPDGNMAFFNSDESGILQAYAVIGLEELEF
ncbi:MAG: PD40 domain-containing protein [Anaerolineae bacterium]|nr:PD40 domain-containing protein [Anaerolineae bacterium]